MSKFYKGVKNSEIKMGNIYRAAIPFTLPQPLKYFEGCSVCENYGKCGDAGIKCDKEDEQCGKVIKRENGINKEIMLNPDNKEATISVVIPHKVRPAIVIQSDVYNQRENYEYVFVAPIQTLKREGKSPGFLRRLTEENSHAQLHYLGMHTGHEAYVNISDIKRLHKSFLLECHEAPPITSHDMTETFVKLGDLLGLEKGKISACKTCESNCDNCELKKVSSVQAVNE